MSNAAKNFDILATSWTFYIIILTVQQNFSDVYPAEILDLLAKLFFPRSIFLKYMYILVKN